ncbi:MAG TPA: hypothetical protein PKD55_05910 [Bellilinea sp.]|nr:hypothetical protein [Bellilinea sp.]
MENISPLGWFLIIGMGSMVIGSYLTLLSIFRRKDTNKNSEVGKIFTSMRTPFEKTNAELNELSRRVSQLNNDAPREGEGSNLEKQ